MPEPSAPFVFALDHVSLRVPDYAQSLRWYCEVLGLDLIREWDEGTELRFCHLRFGQTKLELIGNGAPQPAATVETIEDHLAPAGVVHLCLQVDDLGQAMAALEARGVPLFDGPLDVPQLDLRLVLIKDNSGNILEIAQRQTPTD